MTEEKSTGEQLDFARGVRDLVRFHQRIGLDFYPFVLPGAQARQAEADKTRRRAPVAGVPPVELQKAVAPGTEAQSSAFAALDKAIASCRNCRRGGEGVIVLSGEGKTDARLLIVLEQTILTETFEGKALSPEDHDLLEKMLAAIKVPSHTVYLAPLVKCAAASGQQTTSKERTACLAFLERQITSLRPRAILVFGEQAAQTLLGCEEPLFHLRGRVETVLDIPVLATYHPGQLRQEPALKQLAWQDLQLLRKVLGRINSDNP